MEINTKEDLVTLLADLQGQMVNMQETIDKLSPVEEVAEEADPEEKPAEEELSDEEVSDIDKLLQED